MLKIHEFWVELLPVFQNNAEFIYYYLDISTVIIFVKLILALPKKMLLESKGSFNKW